MKFISKPSPISLIVFVLGAGVAVFGVGYWGLGKHLPNDGDAKLLELQAQRAQLSAYDSSRLVTTQAQQQMLDARLWHKDDFDKWSSNISDGALALQTIKNDPGVDPNSNNYLIQLEQLDIENLSKFLAVVSTIEGHAGTRILTVDLQTTSGDPGPTRFDHAFLIFSVVFPHSEKQVAAP